MSLSKPKRCFYSPSDPYYTSATGNGQHGRSSPLVTLDFWSTSDLPLHRRKRSWPKSVGGTVPFVNYPSLVREVWALNALSLAGWAIVKLVGERPPQTPEASTASVDGAPKADWDHRTICIAIFYTFCAFVAMPLFASRLFCAPSEPSRSPWRPKSAEDDDEGFSGTPPQHTSDEEQDLSSDLPARKRPSIVVNPHGDLYAQQKASPRTSPDGSAPRNRTTEFRSTLLVLLLLCSPLALLVHTWCLYIVNLRAALLISKAFPPVVGTIVAPLLLTVLVVWKATKLATKFPEKLTVWENRIDVHLPFFLKASIPFFRILDIQASTVPPAYTSSRSWFSGPIKYGYVSSSVPTASSSFRADGSASVEMVLDAGQQVVLIHPLAEELYRAVGRVVRCLWSV